MERDDFMHDVAFKSLHLYETAAESDRAKRTNIKEIKMHF